MIMIVVVVVVVLGRVYVYLLIYYRIYNTTRTPHPLYRLLAAAGAGSQRIVITGHSLGGAIAAVARPS